MKSHLVYIHWQTLIIFLAKSMWRIRLVCEDKYVMTTKNVYQIIRYTNITLLQNGLCSSFWLQGLHVQVICHILFSTISQPVFHS